MERDIEFYQKHLVINSVLNKKRVIYYSDIMELTYTVKNKRNYLRLFFFNAYNPTFRPGILIIKLYEISCFGNYIEYAASMDYEQLSEIPPMLKKRLIVNE